MSSLLARLLHRIPATPPGAHRCPGCGTGYGTAPDASLCNSTHHDPQDLDPSDIWGYYDDESTHHDQGETR